MQEYFGESAKKYIQPSDKFFTLFPALERMLPPATPNQKLIDLACGTGDLFEFIFSKGYDYTGVDISDDMLKQAKEKHPQALFIKGDATKLIMGTNGCFDAIFCNMLFPSISSKQDFLAIFKVMSELVQENGIIIVSSGHPCFDGYMGKKFFCRTDIETTYRGYFQSGFNYKVYRKLNGNDFTFDDHHWTLSDYFEAANKVGLHICAIDECPLAKNAPPEIIDKVNDKGTPSYIVFSLKK